MTKRNKNPWISIGILNLCFGVFFSSSFGAPQNSLDEERLMDIQAQAARIKSKLHLMNRDSFSLYHLNLSAKGGFAIIYGMDDFPIIHIQTQIKRQKGKEITSLFYNQTGLFLVKREKMGSPPKGRVSTTLFYFQNAEIFAGQKNGTPIKADSPLLKKEQKAILRLNQQLRDLFIE